MILLFVINAPEFFLSHRLPLAVAARSSGFIVHVATGPGSACEKIAELGFVHHLWPISRSGTNLLAELHSFWRLYRLLRKVRPDLVHLVTIKPVIYGGLSARLAGVPAVVAAISGLGSVFISRIRGTFGLRRCVEWLYCHALRHRNLKVIFQNPSDRAVLVGFGAVCDERAELIKGSGVSLSAYPMYPEPSNLPVVVLAARLLKEKGIREYVEAAKILKDRGVAATFWLAGSPDPENVSSVTTEEINQWCSEKTFVKLLGFQTDIASLFAKSNIVVLPSYREGLPKVLVEAAACGRAVVTTDVPGCRDAIEPGVTGLLVPVRSALDLANAIQVLIENPNRRNEMGLAGRALAEKDYAVEKIVQAHLKIYRELLGSHPSIKWDGIVEHSQF